MGPLVVRADASREIGAGHVVRCQAIAQAWADRGGDVVFVCAEIPPLLEGCLLHEGYRVVRTMAAAGEATDAHEVLQTAREVGASAVVVDGYRFTESYVGSLQDGAFVMEVSDAPDGRTHRTNWVLNPNLYARAEEYQTTAGTRLLVGARFALLRRSFSVYRDLERDAPGTARRLMVTAGGADAHDLTGRVLSVLRAVPGPLLVDVIVGAANPRTADLRTIAAGLPHEVHVTVGAEDMPDRMRRADLALAATGSTTWELAFMGVPTLGVSTAPNQRPVAASAADAGFAEDLGPVEALDDDTLLEALRSLMDDPERRGTMTDAGMGAIDGLGAERVASALASDSLMLRLANWRDRHRLFEWANDSEVRRRGFSPDSIPWDSHLSWLRKRLADPRTLFLIAEHEGEPAGQVRFDVRDDVAVLGFSLAPQFRRKGLGSRLLRASLSELDLRTDFRGTVVAYVRPDNEASLRSFVKAGFQRASDTVVQGVEVAEFRLSLA